MLDTTPAVAAAHAASAIDWPAVGYAIGGILAGAGAAIGALWGKLKAKPAIPLAPPNGSTPTLLSTTLDVIRGVEDALRDLRDTNRDTQLSLASQLGALREIVEELQDYARTERRSRTGRTR